MADLSHAIEHLEGVIECDRLDGYDKEAPERVASYEAAIAHLRRLPPVLAELERLAVEKRREAIAADDCGYAGEAHAYDHAARLLRGEENGHG